MGNYHSSCEFPAKATFMQQSFARVQLAAKRADALLERRSSSLRDGDARLSRREFMAVFTDPSKAADGEFFELGVQAFRACDPKQADSAAARDLLLLAGLFTKIGSGSAAVRVPWLLARLFQSPEGLDASDSLTVDDVRQLVLGVSRAFLAARATSRGLAPGEDIEIVHTIFAEAAAARQGGAKGKGGHGDGSASSASDAHLVPATWLGAWLQTEPAVHLLVTRFQMLAESFEKAVDERALPQLVAIVDPSAFLGGGGGAVGGAGSSSHEDAEADDASMRASILSAVTGRQAMGELQFKTGMTPAALGRLKAEFSARATDLGTLDLQAFREIMLLQFPGLKEDPSVVDKLFKNFDTDETGSIEFKEFVLGASKMVRGSIKDKIQMLFDIFDADNSGSVTIKELMRFVRDGANDLDQVFSKAKSMVSKLEVATPGVVTLDEFRRLMLQEPVMVVWGNSIARSASLQIVNKALGEVAVLLERMRASATAAATNGRVRSEEEEAAALKRPAPEGEMASAIAATFRFPSLYAMWDARIAAKTAALAAKETSSGAAKKLVGADDLFMQRLKDGPATAHKGKMASTSTAPVAVSGGGTAPPPPPFLEDLIMLDDMPRFLETTFRVVVPRTRTVSQALRSLYDNLVATRAAPGQRARSEGGKDDDGDEDDGGVGSGAVLPARHVLTQLALALARSPDELALVMYRQADLDGDGTLTVPELHRWMFSQQSTAGGGMGAAQKLLVSLDIDGDGVITEAEFNAGIMRNPGLLDTFGFLLGTLDVPVGAAPPQSGGGGGKQAAAGAGVASGSAAVVDDAVLRSQTMLPDWAGDTLAAAATVSSTFAGANAFGIGLPEEEGAPRRRLTESERIAARRRRIMISCQKLAVSSEEESKRMALVANRYAPALDKARRKIDIQCQQQRLAVVLARRLLADIALDGALAPGRPASAGPRRPVSAASVRRPGTASGARGAGGGGRGEDGGERPRWKGV